MPVHPEGDGGVNELIREVESIDVVKVWCLGCKDWRRMNAAYAQYCGGEIKECGICRK